MYIQAEPSGLDEIWNPNPNQIKFRKTLKTREI